jgi:hypothetical protein
MFFTAESHEAMQQLNPLIFLFKKKKQHTHTQTTIAGRREQMEKGTH